MKTTIEELQAIVLEYNGHELAFGDMPIASVDYVLQQGFRSVLASRTSIDADKKTALTMPFDAWCTQQWDGRIEELKVGTVPTRSNPLLTFKMARVERRLKTAQGPNAEAARADIKAARALDEDAREENRSRAEGAPPKPTNALRMVLTRLVDSRDAAWHERAEAAYKAIVDARSSGVEGAADEDF